MSLCERLRNLTALAAIALTSCTTRETTPTRYYDDQEATLDQAIQAVCRNDPDTALTYLNVDAKRPSYDCLRALALLSKWDKNKLDLLTLKEADEAFKKVIDDFVKTPGIIELIQEDLKPYFATDHDEKLKKEIKKFIPLLEGLNGAEAFIYFADGNYKGTKFWLEKYLKTDHPSDARRAGLKDAMNFLIANAESEYLNHLRSSAMSSAPLERKYHSEQMDKAEKRLAGYKLIAPIFPEPQKNPHKAELNVVK